MLLFRWCRPRMSRLLAGVRQTLATRLWVRPAATHLAGTWADLVRTRGQLLAENALLRQQLLVLRRSVKRPVMTTTDRALLVLLAGHVRPWQQALLVVQPATLRRWHRAGFRAFWRRKSRPDPGRPPLPMDTVALIESMPGVRPATARANVGDLPAEPCLSDLGVRLPPRHRPHLPAALRRLRDRTGLAPGRACRRDPPPDGHVGRAAAPGGHPVRPASAVPDPGQRRHVRGLHWPISPSGRLYAAHWYAWWRPPRTGTARTGPLRSADDPHSSGRSGTRCARTWCGRSWLK